MLHKKFKNFRSGFNASVANYVKMEESTYQCNEYINLNQLKNGPEPVNQAADGNFDCRHHTKVNLVRDNSSIRTIDQILV